MSKAGKADKAGGIWKIKLSWRAVIYILLLQQINHLFPSAVFLIFPRNFKHTNYNARGEMLDVWLEGHAGNCVNPGCAFTLELVFGRFQRERERGGGVSLLSFGC